MHRERVDFPYAKVIEPAAEPPAAEPKVGLVARIPSSIPTGLGRSVQVPPAVMLALLLGLLLLVPIVAARRRRRIRTAGSSSEAVRDEDGSVGFPEDDIPPPPSLPPSARSSRPGLFPAPEGVRWVLDPTDESPTLERPRTGLFEGQRGPEALSGPALSVPPREDHDPVGTPRERALDMRLVVTNDAGSISAQLNISTAMKPPAARILAAGAAGLLLLRALRQLWR
jgi:hypothetical protein